MAKTENLKFINRDYRQTECDRKNVQGDLIKLYMNLTHQTIYISFRLDFICIFAARKPQKIAFCKHTAAVHVEIPKSPVFKLRYFSRLCSNFAAKAIVWKIFCSSFIIRQCFWPVVFLLHKIFLCVGRIFVYHRRCIWAQSQAFEPAAITKFRERLM